MLFWCEFASPKRIPLASRLSGAEKKPDRRLRVTRNLLMIACAYFAFSFSHDAQRNASPTAHFLPNSRPN